MGRRFQFETQIFVKCTRPLADAIAAEALAGGYASGADFVRQVMRERVADRLRESGDLSPHDDKQLAMPLESSHPPAPPQGGERREGDPDGAGTEKPTGQPYASLVIPAGARECAECAFVEPAHAAWCSLYTGKATTARKRATKAAKTIKAAKAVRKAGGLPKIKRIGKTTARKPIPVSHKKPARKPLAKKRDAAAPKKGRRK